MKKYIPIIFLIFITFFLSARHTSAQTCNTGDGNGDRIVDIKDYVIWIVNYGKNISGAQNGDFNCNGKVDGLDFIVWFKNYGKTIPTPTPTRTPTPTPTRTPTPTVPPTITPTPGAGTRITYTSSSDDFTNPERGFMKQSNIFVDKPFSASQISVTDPNTESLVWVYFHLENYRDPRDGKGVVLPDYQGRDLNYFGPGTGTDTVAGAFNEARKKGLKLVIRFLYIGYGGLGSTSDPNSAEPDAPLSLVQRHLDQLAPVLQQNKDVIATVQTGFVGYWGEWHSSKYLYSIANRKAVTDKLLSVVPPDRMLGIRYPKYTQAMYGGPITIAQAYNGTSISRLGFYDDAFLKDSSDDGTFTSNAMGSKISTYCDASGNVEQCWRNYFSQQATFTPAGGEAGTHGSPSSYANCPNALTQLANLHFSFIHDGYAKAVLDLWKSQGCYSEISRRFGYRLELKEVTIPNYVIHGSTYVFNIVLKNTGFAALYNPRSAYLVLVNASSRYEMRLDVHPRLWFSGQEYNFNTSVQIPANVVPGMYKLALWLPDDSLSLRNNVKYSVRFANLNVWDATSGLNILTPSFEVR